MNTPNGHKLHDTMKKKRTTLSCILRLFSMAQMPFAKPGCKVRGLSFNASSPKVAAKSTAMLYNEDSDSSSCFGVW